MNNNQPTSLSRAPSNLLLAACLMAVVVAGRAQQAPTALRVSVVVPPRVTLAVQAPAQIEITDQDVARGYVELSSPSELVVRTNGKFGVLLDVRVPRGLFTSLRIQGDTTATLPGEGGVIALQPSTPESGGAQKLRWSYRFALEPALPAGRYDWPVQIAGQPVQAGSR